MMASRGVTVLGATGSIGLNTLDVIASHRHRFHVVALTANQDVPRMLELCRVHKPRFAVMAQERAAELLQRQLRELSSDTEVMAGPAALERVAALPDVDAVMAAIVGSAGLLPTLAAARAGKRVMLANKEALVMAGALFMDAVRQSGAELLPVDSEHNAVFQCLPPRLADGLERAGVRRILLTASGGPFRQMDSRMLETVTPEQACAHPNWVMGRKISVDSATMMNKGLEVIEACWLFGATPEQIDVVLHPQSIVHSMVEYEDGSVLGQMGSPDMRTPIAYALAWPERIASGAPRLDLFAVARLDFEKADEARFPSLRLAYEAVRRGGTAAVTLNAANEIAVAAFLDRRLPFTAITRVIENTLGALPATAPSSLDVILQADAAARERAHYELQRFTG